MLRCLKYLTNHVSIGLCESRHVGCERGTVGLEQSLFEAPDLIFVDREILAAEVPHEVGPGKGVMQEPVVACGGFLSGGVLMPTAGFWRLLIKESALVIDDDDGLAGNLVEAVELGHVEPRLVRAGEFGDGREEMVARLDSENVYKFRGFFQYFIRMVTELKAFTHQETMRMFAAKDRADGLIVVSRDQA